MDGFSIQFNSIFYFSELYNSEKHIHVIQYLNNRLDIITKTSLDYTMRWDSKRALLVIVVLPLVVRRTAQIISKPGAGTQIWSKAKGVQPSLAKIWRKIVYILYCVLK